MDQPKGSTGVCDGSSAVHARLLGDFLLTDADGRSLLPQSRKARALIAYLILADGKAVSRQRLMTLGWSERAEDQARASLRQALYEARSLAIGDQPLLLVDRGSAAIREGVVQSDVDLIVSIARTGRPADLAERLGHGLAPLLGDLDDIDPAFDEWLASERTRQRGAVRSAVVDATNRALSAGSPRDARRLAAFLAEDDPLDEPVARLLMDCCQACDDRAGVHRAFERARIELRRELGVAPTPETTASYHRCMTVPPRIASGETPIEPLLEIMTQVGGASRRGAPAPVLRGSSANDTFSPFKRLREIRLWPIVCALAGAALAGSALWRTRAPIAPHVIAVESLQVPQNDPMAQAVRTGLSNDLARAMLGNPTRLDIGQIGDPGVSNRSAQLVLSGTAHSEGNSLRASVGLNNVADGNLLWSKDYSVPAAHPDALRQQMAANVAMVLACALDTRHDNGHPPSIETIRLYLGACDNIDDYNLGPALGLLRQVTRADPQFSRGWSQLATTEALVAQDAPPQEQVQAFRAAVADARRALRLDPHDGLAYYALANTRTGMKSWLWREAVVDAGLRADPDNSELYDTRSEDLLDVGRVAEGLAALHHLAQLDPLMPVKAEVLIRGLAFNGHLDEAEDQIRKADSFWPNNAMIWSAKFDTAARVGDPAQAGSMLRDPARPDFMDDREAEHWRLFLRARTTPTPANLDAAARAIEEGVSSEPDPFLAAGNLADLGLINRAYRALDQVQAGDDLQTKVLFRSYMERFRADHHFMPLALRLGLIPIWLKTSRWPDFCSAPSHPYDCAAEAQRAKTGVAPAPFVGRQDHI